MAVALFLAVAAGATASQPAQGMGAVWGVAKAVSLHLVFASAILFAVWTSKSWREQVTPLEDGGWPSLRSLAILAPASVVLQVALGAAYRQNLVGLVPHVSWAFVTTIIVLAAAAIVLTQDASPRALRRWSVALLCATLLQVMLGVFAFLARLTAQNGDAVQGWMTGAVHAHVGTGSLVLGFTVALSAWIFHNVITIRRENGKHAVSTGRQS